MIKDFNTVNEYNAFTPEQTESALLHVEETNQVAVSGVNVVTDNPQRGDVVFLDSQKKTVYIQGSTVVRSLISSAWTHVGYVFFRSGRTVGVVDKNGADLKYLDVCQYAVTAITSASITLRLRMAPDYDVETSVAVELSSTDISAATAAEISAAVAAKAEEVGDTNAWWAYLSDDGAQIIVQSDTCVTWQQMNYYGASGCTIANVTWEDMPESSSYWRGERGYYTNYWGVMSIARTKAWATGSGRVPTAQEPVGPSAGNSDPVKPSEFENSEYCTDLRAAYATYDEYLEKCYRVVFPQKYGCFALPDGATLTAKYGPKTAPTKDGGTKYKYPALAHCVNVNYGNANLAAGKWNLPGVDEGCRLIDDDTLAALESPIAKMGTIVINNSTHRWFAQRYDVYHAWFFNGWDGNLGGSVVGYTFRVQAVTLLTID